MNAVYKNADSSSTKHMSNRASRTDGIWLPRCAFPLRRARTAVLAPLTLKEGDYKRKAGKVKLIGVMQLIAHPENKQQVYFKPQVYTVLLTVSKYRA